jgi:transcription initiation factor TFIID TATA-box-binding protein
LGANLNLRTIALSLPNSSCIKTNLNNTRTIKIELKNPKANVFVYKSGKMNCYGAKSEEDSRKAITIMAKKIKYLLGNISLQNFRIVNIVATCKLNFEIKLSQLNCYLSFGNYEFFYEPELFPGLRYSMNNPKITLIIFPKGVITFAGAKNRKEITMH